MYSWQVWSISLYKGWVCAFSCRMLIILYTGNYTILIHIHDVIWFFKYTCTWKGPNILTHSMKLCNYVIRVELLRLYMYVTYVFQLLLLLHVHAMYGCYVIVKIKWLSKLTLILSYYFMQFKSGGAHLYKDNQQPFAYYNSTQLKLFILYIKATGPKNKVKYNT